MGKVVSRSMHITTGKENACHVVACCDILGIGVAPTKNPSAFKAWCVLRSASLQCVPLWWVNARCFTFTTKLVSASYIERASLLLVLSLLIVILLRPNIVLISEH